ncbi:MAG: hypothetical protein WBY53_16910 [Acidobacteriaceae bacterium]
MKSLISDSRAWLRVTRRIAMVAGAVGFASYCSHTISARARQADGSNGGTESRQLGSTPGNAYVGASTCAECHAGIARIQPATSMAQAATDPANVGETDKYRAMEYREGTLTYAVVHSQNGLRFQVSDGNNIASAPIRWIFGAGITGQTFVLERDGKFYESRASYYSALRNLDLTVGHPRARPSSITAALGRPLDRAEVAKCFPCHLSEDIFSGKLEVASAHPGVSCENCHGAGGRHASNEEDSRNRQKYNDIFDPSTLAPVDINDFCGSCHRTTPDVLATGIHDIRNIRFQPYRLENSACYNPADARITCISCHNPHRPLDTNLDDYDHDCLACHAGGKITSAQHAAPKCPRATHRCASCHMPKIELPGAHYAFTDHYIRVVKPGQPYPG